MCEEGPKYGEKKCRMVKEVTECREGYRQTCTTHQQPYCAEVTKKKCHKKPGEMCGDVPKQVCSKVPKESCKMVPMQSCKDVPKVGLSLPTTEEYSLC